MTEDLLSEHASILSAELVDTIRRMGIDSRYITFSNAPAFLTGRERTMVLDGTATTLAVTALRRCLESAPTGRGELGLLIGVTNTQARLLPGLAPEMVAEAADLLPSSVLAVNMQGQGCSAMQKAVEVAGWYLACNPDKLVAVVASEANSVYAPRVDQEHYASFREIGEGHIGGDWMAELQKTGAMLQNFLFGDGASCLLLGCEETATEFGAMRHLTNLQPDDQELVRIDGGGSLAPQVGADGRPSFFMEPATLLSGPSYVVGVAQELVTGGLLDGRALDELSPLLMHTGSRKLLDAVCRELGIPRESAAVRPAYDTLRKYGNLSSASIGFMLSEGRFEPGVGLMAGFGGGFSATAGVLRFH